MDLLSVIEVSAVLDLVIAHLEDADPRDAKAVSALYIVSEKLMAATRGIEDILGDERRADRQRGGLAIDPNTGDCSLMPKREG